MGRVRSFLLVGLLAGTLAGSAAVAQRAGAAEPPATSTVSISSQANIFGAGSASPPQPGGGGAGTLPPVVNVPSAANVVTFSRVTGSITCGGGCDFHGPAGGSSFATHISAYGGISGVALGKEMFVVGVFLGASLPGSPPPTDTGTRSPQLGQVFYVGDGSGGEVTIPAGATRLFLGFADANGFQAPPGYYADNQGSVTATVNFGVEQQVHIGTVEVSLSERLKRLAEQLHGRFVSDSSRKEAIEAALPGQRDDVRRAQAKVSSLEGQIAGVVAQIDKTKSFIAAYATAAKSLPADVQAQLQARASLEATVIDLEDQLVQAQQAGDGARARGLQQSLSRARSQLDRIDAALKGHDGTIDKQGNDYIARLRGLQDSVFKLRQQLAAAIRDRAAAQDAENRAHTEETAIDADLLSLDAEIVNLDFDLRNVSVSANGKPVFSADITGPYLDLQQIDAELAALEPQLTGVVNVRMSLLKAFVAAENRSIDALRHVTSVIQSNALIKAGIDGLDYFYEVSKGFGQGGPIGALGAAVKKGLEGLPGVLETINSDWGAGEFDKFDKEYKANVKHTLTAPVFEKAAEIGWTRVFKDTVNKPLKDWANAGFLKLYEKLYKDVPAFYSQAGPLPPLGTSGPGAVQALIKRLKTFQEWAPSRSAALAKLRQGGSFPTWDKLKYGLVKDLAKAAGKAALDLREQEAWTSYFEAEVEARGVFELWQKAWTEELAAEDQKAELELKKTKILEGFSPAARSLAKLDKPFPKGATLEITLTVVRPGGAKSTLVLDVLVAGKTASAGPGYRYTLSAKGLEERRNGLGLDVVAR